MCSLSQRLLATYSVGCAALQCDADNFPVTVGLAKATTRVRAQPHANVVLTKRCASIRLSTRSTASYQHDQWAGPEHLADFHSTAVACPEQFERCCARSDRS